MIRSRPSPSARSSWLAGLTLVAVWERRVERRREFDPARYAACRRCPSAKGKPCVALADPLPPNAPDVPVKVGPAPEQLVVEDLAPGTGTEVTATLHRRRGLHRRRPARPERCSTRRTRVARLRPSRSLRSSPGWQQGLLGMKVGGKRLLGIPSEQAYGPAGSAARDRTRRSPVVRGRDARRPGRLTPTAAE